MLTRRQILQIAANSDRKTRAMRRRMRRQRYAKVPYKDVTVQHEREDVRNRAQFYNDRAAKEEFQREVMAYVAAENAAGRYPSYSQAVAHVRRYFRGPSPEAVQTAQLQDELAELKRDVEHAERYSKTAEHREKRILQYAMTKRAKGERITYDEARAAVVGQ